VLKDNLDIKTLMDPNAGGISGAISLNRA